MNKKEILKSINDIDDKLLIEGEDFFTPEEPQENLSIYRKKGICLKPFVTVAACAVVVVAAAIFAANLGNLPENFLPASENPDNTLISDEGADITILEPMTEAMEETSAESTEAEQTQLTDTPEDAPLLVDLKTGIPDEFNPLISKECIFVNFSQSTPFIMTNTYYTGNVKPYPVRLFVLKDGEPTIFSTKNSKDVYSEDMIFEPNSEIEFSPSFTIDENDGYISILCMYYPDSVEARDTSIEQTDIINLGCKETIEYDTDSEFTDSPPNNIMPISLNQGGDACYLYVDLSRGGGYLTVFVNGKPCPIFNAVAKGDYTKAVKDPERAGYVRIKLDESFIDPGDIVQATVQYTELEDNSVFSYCSHRIQIQ